MDNDRNWRFRLELCNQVFKLSESNSNQSFYKKSIYDGSFNVQVAALVPLCSSEEVLAHLAPLCLLLVNDRVSEVTKRVSKVIICKQAMVNNN